MAWDLVTEMFDYELLKNQKSIIHDSLEAFFKNKEIYGVK